MSRPLGELVWGFGAPASAVAVGENRLELEMRPGTRLGEPARFSQAEGIVWKNLTRTVSRDRHDRGTVDLLPVWGSSSIIARGEYPISEPAYRIDVAVPNPEERAAVALLRLLAESGIQVNGSVRVAMERQPSTGKRLARITSPPLADLLPPILTASENWYAEMLLRILAAEMTGEGRLDTGRDLLGTFLLEDVGVPEGSFHLDDASGLSPYNLLTPETVVAVLGFAWQQPWREQLLAAMARPGQGTLEVWPGLPPVYAKTGSIRHSVALAGCLPSGDSEPVFFVVFVNHRPEDGPAARAEIGRLLRNLN